MSREEARWRRCWGGKCNCAIRILVDRDHEVGYTGGVLNGGGKDYNGCAEYYFYGWVVKV